MYEGAIDTVEPQLEGSFAKIMKWADEFRRLKVRANCDSGKDSAKAVEFGAEGIGLCRTEHMFFDENRIDDMRRMILSHTTNEREAALDRLLPYQVEDFKEIYSVMEDRPVTIRLLDPPLHEFLPHTDEEIKHLAREMSIKENVLKEKVESLKEFNPMLGHRGCRLAVTYPEIARMQAKAIITAALAIEDAKGIKIHPEIMIPLVGIYEEIKFVKDVVVSTVDEVLKTQGRSMEYQVGTMIEIPRAALLADEIAREAEFFSFGTNDLTQMTYGFSRDDTGKILREYEEKSILSFDPFRSIDRDGVGKLMHMAVEMAKKERGNIKLGICGEHGGDPNSVAFCHQLGLHYVSCSPYRVPVAKLSAAQAAICENK